MIGYLCPGCHERVSTSLPERVGNHCHLCAARATWDSLPADMQEAIDAAIRHGAIAGLVAMREANPPIRLPRAMDVLQFRYDAGVGHR
jgi:hypothetical protein